MKTNNMKKIIVKSKGSALTVKWKGVDEKFVTEYVLNILKQFSGDIKTTVSGDDLINIVKSASKRKG